MVLTKGFDERGLAFFTNYGSRKAGELEAKPEAALLFHWPELGRQVRIEGAVARVPRAETEAYARSRSRASQLSALASPQSQPVPGREWLERRVAELDREHAGAELPVGEDWGGYRLAPSRGSSGSTGPTACTTASATCPTAGGWRIERLGP